MNEKLYRCLPSKDNMVGVEFTNELINVYFPIGYDIENLKTKNKEIEAILKIIRSISLCKNNNTNYEYDYKYGDNDEAPINSYLWVLNDYLKNGLYNIQEKKYIVSQKGKINWKKTFLTQPYFSNDEIVYLNPIVEYNSRTDNIITEIHAKCINICINKIGWLFGNFKLIEQNISDIPESMKKIYLDILKKELSVSFNDKKKTLLNHLIRIISEDSSNNGEDTLNNMLVNNYNYAWEVMIREVFGNDKDLKKYFPKIEWNLKYSANPKPSMRPDSVINKDSKLYILDAKYYKYGIIGSGELPGSEDVDKQITYGEFNSKKSEFNDVYNAFVMPYNKNSNSFNLTENIVEVGNVTNNARIEKNNKEKYKKIAVILVDTKYLIDKYFKRKKLEEFELSKLIDSIEESIKYIKTS